MVNIAIKINKLFLYFTEGNYLKIKEFILSNHLLINIRDEKDNTVLHKIIENDTLTENQKIELVKLCLSHGIDVSATNSENITPLHLACKIQSFKIVQLLLNSGADDKIDQKDWNGKTPLDYATIGKNIVMAAQFSCLHTVSKCNISAPSN